MFNPDPLTAATSNSMAVPTSLAALLSALAATTTAPASACWHARIVSSGTSVAPRMASAIAARRAAFSSLVDFGSLIAVSTAR